MLLSACATTSQYTSGQAYLEGYEHPAYAVLEGSVDQDVRDIAAVEPNLAFPARIGLARIENARLTTVPADEAEHWQELAGQLGESYGEFVPLSQMIAAMVARPNDSAISPAQRVVADIRRGSARQHLDYVLVYEVSEQSDQKSNSLRVADLTILGLYVIPSRDIRIDATASAMLIDVRNGYPYGTATAFAEQSKSVTAAGGRTNRKNLSYVARVEAVENLTSQVAVFLRDLREKTGSPTSIQAMP
jgi:hypothetical protein